MSGVFLVVSGDSNTEGSVQQGHCACLHTIVPGVLRAMRWGWRRGMCVWSDGPDSLLRGEGRRAFWERTELQAADAATSLCLKKGGYREFGKGWGRGVEGRTPGRQVRRSGVS